MDIDLRSKLLPAYTQLPWDGCESSAAAQCIWVEQNVNDPNNLRPPYGWARAWIQYWTKLKGHLPKRADTLIAKGVLMDVDYPDTEENCMEKPSADKQAMALFPIKTRREIAVGLCYRYLKAGKVVWMKFPIFDEFRNIGKDGMMKYENKNTGVGSMHSMVLCGHKEIKGRKYFIFRNSYGPGWGDNGDCYIPYAFFARNLNALQCVVLNPPVQTL